MQTAPRNILHETTPSNPTTIISTHCRDKKLTQVLLATAVVNVRDSGGGLQPCRVLLDSGSQSSFITENCMQRLGLKRTKANHHISGIGQTTVGKTRGMVNLSIHSRLNEFEINVEALIYTQLTSNLPNIPIPIDDWGFLKHLKLADPEFNTPGPIDILLGADAFEDVVGEVKIHGPPGMPTARSTEFGWILSGRISQPVASFTIITNHWKPSSQISSFPSICHSTTSSPTTEDNTAWCAEKTTQHGAWRRRHHQQSRVVV
jgi:Putative peptidase (DUF1758)